MGEQNILAEIGKIYDSPPVPLGYVREYEGNRYRMVSFAGDGSKTIRPDDPLTISAANVATLVALGGSVSIDATAVAYTKPAASTTVYFLVQEGGNGYASVDDALVPAAASTDGAKLIADADEDARLEAVVYDDGTATVAEVAAALVLSNKSFIIGAGVNGVDLTGTVAHGNAGTTLTGTGTKFLTELKVGMRVVFDKGGTPETLLIASIESDTSATLAAAAAASTPTGKTLTRASTKVKYLRS